MEKTLKVTPLFKIHQNEGARMIPFAGWQMPLDYGSILEEHRAVREDKGLFDLSHMGEIEVTGRDGQTFLQNLITGDLNKLAPHQALYTVMCNENGGILDDLILYHLGGKFLLVVNASNTDKILMWMREHKGQRAVEIHNRTDETGLLSVQGPRSENFLQTFCSARLNELPYYYSVETTIDSSPAVISRTGYTGEDGFEIYIGASKAARVWTMLREKGIRPVGLGARDTLRLESVYLLYGNDMDESTSPLEVGLAWVVQLEKGNFIGRNALLSQKEQGIPRKQVAFTMKDRSLPRKEYKIAGREREIGICTSGTFSPTLQKGIGLALVETSRAEIPVAVGSEISVEIRGAAHPAVISKKPFVQGSVKRGS